MLERTRNCTSIGVVLLVLAMVGCDLPPVEIEIGKDTTYITAPLNDDGTVNYVAYMNARLSEGVTPENNAAIILARAFGPEMWAPEALGRTTAMIGMAAPPEKGAYFVTLDTYAQALPQEEAGESPETSISDTASEELDKATAVPWTTGELTIVSGWLEANAAPLALIEEATAKSRAYFPMASRKQPPDFSSARTLNLASMLQAGEALTARAMRKLGHDDLAGAWRDAMVAWKFARLMAQEGTPYSLLCAHRIEELACAASARLVTKGKASQTELRSWRGDLHALPPLHDVRDSLVFFRLHMLDVVMAIYRSDDPDLGFGEPLPNVSRPDVDWNALLRTYNTCYDYWLAPAMIRNAVQRRAALDKLAQAPHAELLAGGSLMAPSLWESWRLTPWARRGHATKSMGTTLMVVIGTGRADALVDHHDVALMREELLLVATGLALHEAETGRFPAKLADLAPKYVKAIPADRFSNDPLGYKLEGKGCVVYSVGENLTDDGGVYDRKLEDEKDDIVFQFKR